MDANLDAHTGLIIIEKRSVVCREKEKPPGVGKPMLGGGFDEGGGKPSASMKTKRDAEESEGG